jgi:hypothetical protein
VDTDDRGKAGIFDDMSAYPPTVELYAAGYRWREEYETVEQLNANGGALQGGAEITQDGVDLNGAAGWVLYNAFRHLHVTSTTWWVHAEFAPDFAADEALTRFLFSTDLGAGKRCYVARLSSGLFRVVSGDTIVIAAAPIAWQAQWRENDRNTVTACMCSGANTLWLNGVQVATSATAWDMTDLPSQLAVGANNPASPGSNWSGTIRRLVIGRGELEQTDVDELHAGTMQTAIAPSRYLLCVTGDAPELVGGDTVTRCTGTAGVTTAVLGAGTAAPGGPHRRAFQFDGVDDTLRIRSSEALQFTDGAADLGFTAALVFKPKAAAALRHVVGVSSGAAAGAWYVAYDGVNELVHWRGVDNAAGAYIGRSAAVGSAPLPRNQALVLTDNGSGASAGLRIYDRSGRIDAADDNSGVYVRRRLTATDLLFGGPGGAAAPVQGDAGLLTLLPGAASPMQAAMLAYRLERYRMVT